MLYEYECPKCHSTKDVEHGLNESPEVTCECTGVPVKCIRLVGGCDFVLKGSCWARDGYTKGSAQRGHSDEQ